MDEPSIGKTYSVMIVVGLSLGLILRLLGLDSLPLAEDALYTLRDSLNFHFSDAGLNRPVYFALQSLILNEFPPTPLVLRLPAFLFGLFGLVATWWFTMRAFGSAAAAGS